MNASATTSNAMPPADPPGRRLQPFENLRRHSRLALLAGVAVLLAGIPFILIKGTPTYQATATVQVAPRYMKNLKDDNELDFQSNSQYRQFVEQQTRTINRPDVVADALRTLAAGPAGDPWRRDGETERRSVERLQRSLRIAAVPDTYLVQVSLAGSEKEGLAEVVNAVVESYITRSREEQVYGSGERASRLKAREAELLALIDAATGQRSDIARELGVTAFKEDDINPFDRLAQKLRENVAEARARRFDAEAKLAAFGRSGETDLTTRSVLENVLIDPGLNSLKSNLNKRRAELVTNMSGLAPEHPGYIAARQELAEIDAEIRKNADQLTGQVRDGLGKRFTTAVDQARAFETDLARELAQTEARSEAYALRYNRAVALSVDLEQLRKELETIRERLNFLAVENGSLGFVRPVTAATEPDLPFGTGKKKLLLLVLAAALAAGLVVPQLAELVLRRIRDAGDAQRALGFAPTGWIAERSDASGERLALDQVKRLASALLRDQDRHGTRAIAFTGIRQGGGTTTLVRDLARCFAGMGISALALEANTAGFDPARRGGLAALLSNADACPDIQCTEGICTLPVGSERLDRLDALAPVLERLSRDYRFILIDAPPLLSSSDSELIIRATGNVIAVIEADALSEGEVREAARLLARLDPPSVGAVVNRILPAGTLFAGIVPALRALTWDTAAIVLTCGWNLLNLLRRRRGHLGASS